jgi:hypothetical protein
MLKRIKQFEICIGSSAKQVQYDSSGYTETGGPWIPAHAVARCWEDFGNAQVRKLKR